MKCLALVLISVSLCLFGENLGAALHLGRIQIFLFLRATSARVHWLLSVADRDIYTNRNTLKIMDLLRTIQPVRD
jgi:hypothetical protein